MFSGPSRHIRILRSNLGNNYLNGCYWEHSRDLDDVSKKFPVLRTSTLTNYYYANMAVSDFLWCLTTWPLFLTDAIISNSGSLFGGLLAKLELLRKVFLSQLIAMDRFVATVTLLKSPC